MRSRVSLVGRNDFRLFVHSLSRRSVALVGIAVFAVFSVIGFARDIWALGAQPPWRLALDVVLSGGIALLYLAAIYVSVRAVIVLAVGQFVLMSLFDRFFGAATTLPLTGAALAERMHVDAVSVIVAVIVGYVCAVVVATTESARFHRIQTEIRLAGEIHQSLVPRITGRLGAFEYDGVSHPSGEVGGDLVDVVEFDGGWAAYLVDVSGHGVRSGVLMGMVKSAVHMAFRRPAPLGRWVSEVSEVLHPLKASSMYATAAAVQCGPGGLAFTVAGHLPILRVRAADGVVEEHTIAQVPLALFEQRAFADAPLPCEPGDLLVLLTDGLTEVFDREDRELGLEAVKAVVAGMRAEPLGAIVEALLAAARAHGPQLDDQTVLLLRRSH